MNNIIYCYVNFWQSNKFHEYMYFMSFEHTEHTQVYFFVIRVRIFKHGRCRLTHVRFISLRLFDSESVAWFAIVHRDIYIVVFPLFKNSILQIRIILLLYWFGFFNRTWSESTNPTQTLNGNVIYRIIHVVLYLKVCDLAVM